MSFLKRKSVGITAIILTFVLSTGCSSNSSSSSSGTAESNKTSVAEQTQVTQNMGNQKSELGIKRRPGIAHWESMDNKLDSLDNAAKWGEYYYFMRTDLTSIDFTKKLDTLLGCFFDTNTKWTDKLPQEFSPDKVLELGKNPGLNIRKIHENGITGKGINIAIIDQPLLIEHEEYAGKIKVYEEFGHIDAASMHGPAMTSLAVGNSIGVAPDANVYYMSAFNWEGSTDNIDWKWIVKAIDRIIEINKELPKKDKIRVISISAAWAPNHKGFNEMCKAVENAEKEGIFVISANIYDNYDHKFWYFGLDRSPIADPDMLSSYSVMPWEQWLSQVQGIDGIVDHYKSQFDKYAPKEVLLVPMTSKTLAQPTGIQDYSFNRTGGWSSVEPYIAGLYAMACQVNPDVTPELFWSKALETGDKKDFTAGGKALTGKIINPEKLIEAIEKA